jgi:hypothetical protein
LFGEAGGRRAVHALDHADSVTASDLTLLECDRSLIRAATLSMIREERAIHLASALLAAGSLPDFALLSLDRRVRATGARLGLRVLPD